MIYEETLEPFFNKVTQLVEAGELEIYKSDSYPFSTRQQLPIKDFIGLFSLRTACANLMRMPPEVFQSNYPLTPGQLTLPKDRTILSDIKVGNIPDSKKDLSTFYDFLDKLRAYNEFKLEILIELSGGLILPISALSSNGYHFDYLDDGKLRITMYGMDGEIYIQCRPDTIKRFFILTGVSLNVSLRRIVKSYKLKKATKCVGETTNLEHLL